MKESEEKNKAISVNQIVSDLAHQFFTLFEKISSEKVWQLKMKQHLVCWAFANVIVISKKLPISSLNV